MKPSLFTYPRFITLLLRLKLLNLTSSFPPLPGGVLDEQIALMRRAQELLGETPLDTITPTKARDDFRKTFGLLKLSGGTFEKVDSIRDLVVPGPTCEIPARLYLPGKETGYPLFVYLHGGGWVIGGLDSADNIARFICKHADCAVLSVDYCLAPEHACPAALEDAFAAVAWAVAHATELGTDPSRLLVGGDSAGGNLTAAVAQLACQRGAPIIKGQVLFYAALDGAHLDTPSFKEFGEESLGLTRRDVEWYLEQYTPEPQDRLDPRISPLLAKDLSGLPPALVVTAEFDVLRDEGEAYAHKMQEAGVNVKLMRCNGMTHGFLSSIGLIRRATLYFGEIAGEIRKMAA
ncbi:MAG: alpha/beta hydrolase [Anaerolineales bacterium]